MLRTAFRGDWFDFHFHKSECVEVLHVFLTVRGRPEEISDEIALDDRIEQTTTTESRYVLAGKPNKDSGANDRPSATGVASVENQLG